MFGDVVDKEYYNGFDVKMLMVIGVENDIRYLMEVTAIFKESVRIDEGANMNVKEEVNARIKGGEVMKDVFAHRNYSGMYFKS